MAKTLIVSNRLPIRIEKKEGELFYMPSEGGLATGMSSIYKEGGNMWLGWPGVDLADGKEKKEVTSNLLEENMLPVFLSAQEVEDFYEGFSNATLWPTFHYFSQFAIYDQGLFDAYEKVNRKFCDAIISAADPDDIIWIHDYQLLLLPKMVRDVFPEISIGFFQHIPFPSYEVFRVLPWRREILLGMLGADLIGFHTYDDMRHFLSSVNRLAGIPGSRGIITTEKRNIEVDSFPMGIDYDRYQNAAASAETIEKEVKYRTSLGDQKLILSIDRLDYSKGIPERLKAFDQLLDSHPEFCENISFLMVVVPSRDNVGEYIALKEEIDLLVGKINGKHGRIDWTPIHYFYRSFPLPALSALYRMAAVALVTPKRDGMNLVCKEYIASRLDQKGVLILSEMAGASKELSDAILINPNDINQITDALYSALTMPTTEQTAHMRIMQDSIKRYNIHHWVKMFMDRLYEIKERQRSLATKTLDKKTIKKVNKKYHASGKRVLFLDYDGTLTGFFDNPVKSKPDEELITVLEKLTKVKENRVVIISGRDKVTLNKWLSHMHLDIIAEHGVWLKERSKDWETIDDLETQWKEDFRPIFETYVDRTPGSFIEEKDYSLVWHYRKVETGLGELRTRELTSHLKYMATDKNLQILEGAKVVEIKSSEVNKGRAAKRWLDRLSYDFVMAIGDDWTDEDTFISMPLDSVTIKVGRSTSEAKYSLDSFKEVRAFLMNL
ncbi:bifunctional alpha,alpha-trehalose-phosphate synthase (UDP-forming)/trehalose-phosphatase [Bacteroidota bacterium]